MVVRRTKGGVRNMRTSSDLLPAGRDSFYSRLTVCSGESVHLASLRAETFHTLSGKLVQLGLFLPLLNSPILTLSFIYETIGYMLQRSDVVEGIYLKQIRDRSTTPWLRSDATRTSPLGKAPAGLIGVVHMVGTDWTGEWTFQLRYLNPPGTRTRPASQWSLNLREKDLGDFEVIGDWLSAQAVLESTPLPGSKPKKGLKLPSMYHPAWMRKWNPNQLRLFEDF